MKEGKRFEPFFEMYLGIGIGAQLLYKDDMVSFVLVLPFVLIGFDFNVL